MPLNLKITLTLMVFILGILGSCTTITNGGVEVGNPNITGKSLTLTPQGTANIYVVKFLENNEAAVTQVSGELFDTVQIPYTFNNDLLNLMAKFSDGEELELTLRLEASDVFSVLLFVLGGQVLPTQVSQEDDPDPCNSGLANPPLEIAETLCSRVVACNQTFTCETCMTETLVVPGLAQQFGAPPGSTLEEAAQDYQDGTLEVDSTRLNICLEDMSVIPCVLVHESFNDEMVPNFNAIKSIVPKPNCAPGILNLGF